MTPEYRLECLRLAVQGGYGDPVEEAERYLKFVASPRTQPDGTPDTSDKSLPD